MRNKISTRGKSNLLGAAIPGHTNFPYNCALLMPRGAEARLGSLRCWRCAARCCKKNLKGGLVVVGGLNLGGSVDTLYNAVSVTELAVEKGATSLLAPVSARKQLVDLSDDMATKITVQYFTDTRVTHGPLGHHEP
ncbi:MAG: hypothetical protein WKF84_14585 [Pyrinomonadaceae bacterium]